MTAQDFINHDQAGLVLCGREDGEYQWIGTRKQWNLYSALTQVL